MLRKIKIILNKNKIYGLKNVEILKNVRLYKTRIKIDNGNYLILNDESYLDNVEITIKGKNNRVIIGKNTKITGKIEVKSNGSLIEIGDDSNIDSEIIIFSGDNNLVSIGKSVKIYQAKLSSSFDNNFIKIGDECLISNSIIRNNDAHRIYKNELLINQGKGITIKERVWLAANTVVLKGVTINSGNIIGIGSIVTKDITNENSIIVKGDRVVEENIRWEE
ncbi:MAG: hypothetical protein ACRDBY_01240 [Cetobacterium sp.]